MNTSVTMLSGIVCAAGRTVRTSTLMSGRALNVGVRRPFGTAFRMLPGLHKTSFLGNGTTSPVFTKKVTSPVAVPAVLAVTRLYVLAQRIDLAVQAKHESLSQILTSFGQNKASASASELLARALLGLVANIAQQPHSIWLAGENIARNQLDSAFKWVLHLVIGGSEKQLAQVMQEAEADLDQLISIYSLRMGERYKVIGATAGLADHLCAIIKANYLPALMSDLVPATSCVIAMGLLGLDLTLPGTAHAQDMAATAHEWQQLGEALSTTPATPVGSAEPPANGQPEDSLALQQAPAPEAESWAAKQVPSAEGSPASEGRTASDGTTASARLPTAAAADTTAEAKSTSSAEAKLPTAVVAADADKAADQATTGSLLGLDPAHAQEVAAIAQDLQQLGEAFSTTPATPVGSAEPPANGQPEGSLALLQAPAPEAKSWSAKQVPATEGSPASEAPTAPEGPTASASLPTAAAADTTAEAKSTSTAEAKLPTAEVAADANKAADQATTGSLLGLDPAHAQKAVATAHDWQQLGEALTMTAATPEGPAEPSANGQSEGSLALLQAPAPQVASEHPRSASEGPTATEGPTASASLPTAAAADTTAEARSTSTAGAQLPTAEVAAGTGKAAAQVTTGVPPAMTDASMDLGEEAGSASEALTAGAPSGKGSEATASATTSAPEPRTGTEGKAAPNSPSDFSVVDAEHSTHAAEGFNEDKAAADSPGSEVWATIPKQVPATESPTASASLLTAAAADTTAEAKSATIAEAELPIAEVAAGADKAAAKAIIGVPPAVIDASVDHEEEEAGSAYEALTAVAPSGKGSEATASATIREAQPTTGTESKAAPDSPSDLSVVDAEHATHAAEGFSDDRAAADSPGADVWATTSLAKFKIRTKPRDPAAESEGDTIAAKHAAEPAPTMPEDLPGSSSPQAYSKGQAAENKAAAQAASTAAAAATSRPAAQKVFKSFCTPTPTAAAAAGSADADVATSASAVSTSGGDDNLTAFRSAPHRQDKVHLPGSAVHTPDNANVTAKSEAGLPASEQAATRTAVPTATGTAATAGVCNSPVQTAVQTSLPTTTKSVSSALPVNASEGISAEAEPGVREATSSAVPASPHHAAPHAQAPVQSSTTSKSGSGSKGVTKWVVHPEDHRLEWPQNPVERKLSSGGTAVVFRARVRSEADLAGLQPPPDMGSLTPGLDLVIKRMTGMESEAMKQLAAREVTVLEAVSNKYYVPIFHGAFNSQETEEGSSVACHSANLLIGLAAGKNVDEIMGLVSTRVRKYKNNPAKLQAVREWLWSFTLHTAYGLAKIFADLHKDRSHRDVKPHNIMLSQRGKTVSIKLIDFASSRLHSEDDVLNDTFSLPQAAPQLVQCVGKVMVGMKDEANDMWAAATVLFQLLMSGHPKWEKEVGPFMFGPRREDMKSYKQTDQQAWNNFGREKIMAEQKLWADSSVFNKQSIVSPAQLATIQELSQGLSNKMQGEAKEFSKMLQGMLHPQAQARMTATTMCNLRWLRDAAKAPLPKCLVPF